MNSLSEQFYILRAVWIIVLYCMTTSPNGNNFRVIGPLWWEFTGNGWIPLTKTSDAELRCFFFICAWANGGVNNRDAGDLRRIRAHYDVTGMEHRYTKAICTSNIIITIHLKCLKMGMLAFYHQILFQFSPVSICGYLNFVCLEIWLK